MLCNVVYVTWNSDTWPTLESRASKNRSKNLLEVFPTKYISFTGHNATLFIHLHKSSFGEKICSKNLWEFRGASFWSVQGITIRPPEFSEKSCKPPWFFLAVLQNYPWSEKSPPDFLTAFFKPPWKQTSTINAPLNFEQQNQMSNPPKNSHF